MARYCMVGETEKLPGTCLDFFESCNSWWRRDGCDGVRSNSLHASRMASWMTSGRFLYWRRKFFEVLFRALNELGSFAIVMFIYRGISEQRDRPGQRKIGRSGLTGFHYRLHFIDAIPELLKVINFIAER